jgi:hypothetical protein
MHIKINTTEMKPNFLLDILWPKTSLRNQQIHLAIIDFDIYIYD